MNALSCSLVRKAFHLLYCTWYRQVLGVLAHYRCLALWCEVTLTSFLKSNIGLLPLTAGHLSYVLLFEAALIHTSSCPYLIFTPCPASLPFHSLSFQSASTSLLSLPCLPSSPLSLSIFLTPSLLSLPTQSHPHSLPSPHFHSPSLSHCFTLVTSLPFPLTPFPLPPWSSSTYLHSSSLLPSLTFFSIPHSPSSGLSSSSLNLPSSLHLIFSLFQNITDTERYMKEVLNISSVRTHIFPTRLPLEGLEALWVSTGKTTFSCSVLSCLLSLHFSVWKVKLGAGV